MMGQRPREHHIASRPRGQALVEMGFVLSLFLMLVLGVAEFGWAFLVNHSLVAAAREGARLAAVTGDLVMNDGRVATRVQEVLSAVNLSGWQVTNTQPTGPGDPVTVTVSLDYQPITGGALAFVGLGPTRFEKAVVMRYEG